MIFENISTVLMLVFLIVMFSIPKQKKQITLPIIIVVACISLFVLGYLLQGLPSGIDGLIKGFSIIIFYFIFWWLYKLSMILIKFISKSFKA